MISVYKCPNCGAAAGGFSETDDILTMEMSCESCGHKMSIEDFMTMASQPFQPGGVCNPTQPPNRTVVFDKPSGKFLFRIGGRTFRVSAESFLQLIKDTKLAIEEAGGV